MQNRVIFEFLSKFAGFEFKLFTLVVNRSVVNIVEHLPFVIKRLELIFNSN